MHPLILSPRALFYRTDCTRRSKFLTHTLQDTSLHCRAIQLLSRGAIFIQIFFDLGHLILIVYDIGVSAYIQMEFFVFLNKLAIFAKCNECSIGRIHYDFSAPRHGDNALKTRKKSSALFNCFYFLLHFLCIPI